MNKATGADIVFGEYLFNGFVRTFGVGAIM